MRTMRSTVAITFGAATAALALASCHWERAAGTCSPSGRDTTITTQVVSGVVQHLSVSSLAPCSGEVITILSEIEVTGASPSALTLRTCDVDLGGTLAFGPPVGIICGGYSESGSYSPGTVRTSGTTRRVDSPPGSYTLQVRHALSPLHWVTVPMVVRAE